MVFLRYACTFQGFYTNELFHLSSVHKCHHVQVIENGGVNLGAASSRLQRLEYMAHTHGQ